MFENAGSNVVDKRVKQEVVDRFLIGSCDNNNNNNNNTDRSYSGKSVNCSTNSSSQILTNNNYINNNNNNNNNNSINGSHSNNNNSSSSSININNGSITSSRISNNSVNRNLNISQQEHEKLSKDLTSDAITADSKQSQEMKKLGSPTVYINIATDGQSQVNSSNSSGLGRPQAAILDLSLPRKALDGNSQNRNTNVDNCEAVKRNEASCLSHSTQRIVATPSYPAVIPSVNQTTVASSSHSTSSPPPPPMSSSSSFLLSSSSSSSCSVSTSSLSPVTSSISFSTPSQKSCSVVKQSLSPILIQEDQHQPLISALPSPSSKITAKATPQSSALPSSSPSTTLLPSSSEVSVSSSLSSSLPIISSSMSTHSPTKLTSSSSVSSSASSLHVTVAASSLSSSSSSSSSAVMARCESYKEEIDENKLLLSSTASCGQLDEHQGKSSSASSSSSSSVTSSAPSMSMSLPSSSSVVLATATSLSSSLSSSSSSTTLPVSSSSPPSSSLLLPERKTEHKRGASSPRDSKCTSHNNNNSNNSNNINSNSSSHKTTTTTTTNDSNNTVLSSSSNIANVTESVHISENTNSPPLETVAANVANHDGLMPKVFTVVQHSSNNSTLRKRKSTCDVVKGMVRSGSAPPSSRDTSRPFSSMDATVTKLEEDHNLCTGITIPVGIAIATQRQELSRSSQGTQFLYPLIKFQFLLITCLEHKLTLSCYVPDIPGYTSKHQLYQIPIKMFACSRYTEAVCAAICVLAQKLFVSWLFLPRWRVKLATGAQV
eukprot:XP_014768605.1 PREDICTED: uncharacterized serine-rich protein C215.13-like [Octopus bimaculoides]